MSCSINSASLELLLPGLVQVDSLNLSKNSICETGARLLVKYLDELKSLTMGNSRLIQTITRSWERTECWHLPTVLGFWSRLASVTPDSILEACSASSRSIIKLVSRHFQLRHLSAGSNMYISDSNTIVEEGVRAISTRLPLLRTYSISRCGLTERHIECMVRHLHLAQ